MDLLEPQKAGLRRDAPGVRYKPAFKTVKSAVLEPKKRSRQAENEQRLGSRSAGRGGQPRTQVKDPYGEYAKNEVLSENFYEMRHLKPN